MQFPLAPPNGSHGQRNVEGGARVAAPEQPAAINKKRAPDTQTNKQNEQSISVSRFPSMVWCFLFFSAPEKSEWIRSAQSSLIYLGENARRNNVITERRINSIPGAPK
jgi:hypothetical protein